ncbi:hypothetical protein CBER1_06735 [Cercospora berteroae]|uniref:Zn(2)-C6 fungal-type domain-containing protein n=1 Tax=Cercospora berteroae TaxID=357750 RepID=A0A2S6BSN2_9PEZI|nr:hypothetical protein CBER1_06735 [Cercospora berteroae]
MSHVDACLPHTAIAGWYSDMSMDNSSFGLNHGLNPTGDDDTVVLNADRSARAGADASSNSSSSARRTSTANDKTVVRGKKRNKPTLNCLECVERKSKCDRARPSCFTCIRRQTRCQYTRIADVIAANPASTSNPRKRSRTDTATERPLQPIVNVEDTHRRSSVAVINTSTVSGATATIPALDENNELDFQQDFGVIEDDEPDELNQLLHVTPLIPNVIDTLAPTIIGSPLSARPSERHALLNLFGAASIEHPFQNYWTDAGGLVEVVASLPNRADAEVLIERYFDTVDPVYPIIVRDAFVADVERFWHLPDHGKHKHDPAQIALQFAVYANAAQDSTLREGSDVQLDMASFYLSCCHQSLCISSYLNRWSLLTVQTMILICHFMITNNRIADAWTISGIVQRQIYRLRLNCIPEDIGLQLDHDTVQVRLRLWQAAMLQDTLLCLRLKRPPSTTYFNVSHYDIQPFRTSNEFRDLYAQFEEPFCQTAPSRFDHLPSRLLYQMVTVASTYFHALMFVFTDRNEKAGVRSDPSGAIRAAHEGMTAFFALIRLSPGHMRVWAAVHSRTYAMAAVIGTMLATHKRNGAAGRRIVADDPQLMLGKSDFDRYVSMLERAQGSPEFRVIQRERLANLKTLQAEAQATTN